MSEPNTTANKGPTSPLQRCTVFEILGVSEEELVTKTWTQKESMITTADDGTCCFVNQSNQLLTPCGEFSTKSVAELKALVSKKASSSAKKRHVQLAVQSGVDIGELQGTLTTEDEAMVQVASNFNCLENASKTMHPNCGLLCDVAAQDCTQGPAAAFGTLPAYINRCHFINDGGQTVDKSVNLLEQVGSHFGVPVNGKFVLKGTETPINLDKDLDTLSGNICAGIHTDCRVLFGRNKASGVFFKTPSDFESSQQHQAPPTYAKVDQCFNASINYNVVGTMNPAAVAAAGDTRKAKDVMARVLIRAAYESVYLAAIARQRKTLLLTLVGGGVFGNPIPLIVEEIHRAHQLWAGHAASKLEDVRLCIFSASTEATVKAELDKLT